MPFKGMGCKRIRFINKKPSCTFSKTREGPPRISNIFKILSQTTILFPFVLKMYMLTQYDVHEGHNKIIWMLPLL